MNEKENIESQNQGIAKGVIKRDHRVILAFHPDDAEKIFSSQSSYGENLTRDFRENVKALNQVYISIQRYLQGIDRSGGSYYPDLEDVHKDLQLYKRSVSDKIPMPTHEELLLDCLQLASQNPPFIHIIRELDFNQDGEIVFTSRFVAPTQKHDDKVIVAYRSTLANSINSIREVLKDENHIKDYSQKFSSIHTISDLPIQNGRADWLFKKMYLTQKDIGKNKTTLAIENLKYVNTELLNRSLRPLLHQAIKEKLVLSLPCEAIRKSGFKNCEKIYDITLLLSKKELLSRYSALTRFLTPKLTNGLIEENTYNDLKKRLVAEEIDDFECDQALASLLYDSATAQPEPDLNTVQVAIEIQKIGDWLNKSNLQTKKDEVADELQAVLKKIKEYGGLLRARSSGTWSINEIFLSLMLKGKIAPILACTVPYDEFLNQTGDIDINNYEHIYLIYKDRKITGAAIDIAVELFEKNEDVYTLHILENLFGLGNRTESELKEFLAPLYLDKLRYTLKKSYKRYLPFLKKIWLTLTSSEISNKNLDQIRKQRRKQSLNSFSHNKKTVEQEDLSKKKIKSIAKERIEATTLSKKEDIALKNLIQYLDDQWAIGIYPVRHEILADANQEASEFKKLIGFADAGATSVKDIVCISNNIENVYAHARFLKENRDNLISYFENKLKEGHSAIVSQKKSLVLPKENDQQKKEIFKAILSHIKLKL